MSAQHTPGPWFIQQELAMQREGCGQDEITEDLLLEDQYCIYSGNPKECTRGILAGHSGHICDIDSDVDDFDDDEDAVRATALANARLIAAAPELLAELRAAHQIIRHALALMTPEQKLEWGRLNAAADVEGEGITRANERADLLARLEGVAA